MQLFLFCSFFYDKADGSSSAEITNTVMNAMYSFFRIFFVCELGEKVTYQFNVFSEKIGDCDWYLFSIELQSVFLIFLSGNNDLIPFHFLMSKNK